jgi:hypothetical protein
MASDDDAVALNDLDGEAGPIPIEDYRPADGDHLCSLWTDPPTDRRAGRRYLNSAAADEARLAILDRSRNASAAAAAERKALARDGVALYTTDEVHVAGEHFDPERMRRFWSAQAQEADRRGIRHVRAVAEMAWEMRGLPGCTVAPAFESSLNPLFSSLRASVICQYGSTRFSARTLLAMVLSHPKIVIGETVFANPFYVDHDRFEERLAALSRDAAEALLRVWTFFLLAQPSLDALGRYVCNSVPTLIAADSVVVALSGLPEVMALHVVRDGVEPADDNRRHRLRAAAHPSRAVADGPWGAVRAAEVDGLSLLTGSLDGERHTITAERAGAFSAQDELRFVAMAWDIAGAIKARPRPSANSV